MELEIAASIVIEAGKIPLRYHGQPLDVQHKAGNEPVTRADRETSAFLVEALRKAFPADVIISEEEEDDPLRLEGRRVWYLDPIDGTKSFIRGGTGYCVMLGLAVEHKPAVGMLYQPNLGTRIYAAQGGGAWCKRPASTPSRLRTTPLDDPSAARLLADKGGDRRAIEAAFGFGIGEPLGSIGIKLSAIALGACELYTNPATHCSSWDTCGPEVILAEAGGRITDMRGRAIRYDNPSTTSLQDGLVASNGPLHDVMVKRLGDLFPPAETR